MTLFNRPYRLNMSAFSAFARRRLAVVMVRLKMAETVSDVSSPRLDAVRPPLTPTCSGGKDD
jgi:hypothetical protein